jgi:hypothetical protein
MVRTVWGVKIASSIESACHALYIRASGSLPKPMKDAASPTISEGRQAFEGDLRSTSGLGTGDGISTHTEKWLQVGSPSRLSSNAMPGASANVAFTVFFFRQEV